jgi:hypothetical protein
MLEFRCGSFSEIINMLFTKLVENKRAIPMRTALFKILSED